MEKRLNDLDNQLTVARQRRNNAEVRRQEAAAALLAAHAEKDPVATPARLKALEDERDAAQGAADDAGSDIWRLESEQRDLLKLRHDPHVHHARSANAMHWVGVAGAILAALLLGGLALKALMSWTPSSGAATVSPAPVVAPAPLPAVNAPCVPTVPCDPCVRVRRCHPVKQAKPAVVPKPAPAPAPRPVVKAPAPQPTCGCCCVEVVIKKELEPTVAPVPPPVLPAPAPEQALTTVDCRALLQSRFQEAATQCPKESLGGGVLLSAKGPCKSCGG